MWWAAVAIIVAGAIVPQALEWYVRGRLEGLGHGYVGRVDAVVLRPFEAALELRGLRIEQERPPRETPFLTAGAFRLGVALERGRPRTRIRVQDLAVNLVDAAGEGRDMWGPPMDLRQLARDLPFDLADVQTQQGELHLRVFHAEPPVDAYVENVSAHWSSLAGCLPPGDDTCDSRLELRADALGEAKLEVDGGYARGQDAGLRLRGTLGKVAAEALSPLLSHYVTVDLHGGALALDFRLESEGERFEAVLAPRPRSVEVLGGDRSETRLARELGVALVEGHFERRDGGKAIRLRYGERGELCWELIDNPLAPGGSG